MKIDRSAEPAPSQLNSLQTVLASIVPRTIACSGGIDSLVLAIVAHDQDPANTTIAHTVTPAVPTAGTARVIEHSRQRSWRLDLVESNEFSDERYLANPTDRCYYCKSNLYGTIQAIAAPGGTVLSGANVDDLGEYRPGLIAAEERSVRHPYVEADIDKAGIRAIATHLGLAEAQLPSSPCLASRLYTGTRVTADRLRAVELGEAVLSAAGFHVNRCRLRDDDVLIELPEGDRERLDDAVIADVARAMGTALATIGLVELHDRAYRPGQAILGIV